MSQLEVMDFLSKDKNKWFSFDEIAKYIINTGLPKNLKKLYETNYISRKKGISPNIAIKRKVFLYRWKK